MFQLLKTARSFRGASSKRHHSARDHTGERTHQVQGIGEGLFAISGNNLLTRAQATLLKLVKTVDNKMFGSAG